jgi:hypothetical protein
VKLAHVKKKRQSERYANQESTDNRDPKSPHTEAASFYKNEDPEHQRRNNDIKAEKGSDAIRKQLLDEKGDIQAMVQEPRHELPIRQEHADNA